MTFLVLITAIVSRFATSTTFQARHVSTVWQIALGLERLGSDLLDNLNHKTSKNVRCSHFWNLVDSSKFDQKNNRRYRAKDCDSVDLIRKNVIRNVGTSDCNKAVLIHHNLLDIINSSIPSKYVRFDL
jgi:hypothetical protein